MSNPLPEPKKLQLVTLHHPGTVEVFGYDAGDMREFAAAEVAAARDCHTCKHYAVCLSPHHDGKHCTNGDRHEPLPPVRLWRTSDANQA